MHQFFYSISKKKKMDAPNVLHLFADGQLLIYVGGSKKNYVADAISP